jgi:hypothetical protein
MEKFTPDSPKKKKTLFGMFLHHKLLLVLDNELNFVTDDIDELSRKI